ncbi:MAG: hypothetical protein ACK4M9_22625 [Anaerobacillus sp.]|uniref:hypothetical protein n=1 Tax=Anaerobacillus sp. TaxID=1872506 RepID=UPI00391C4F6D
MKKFISLNLILHIVFWVGTILTVFIIYKDIDTSLSFRFIIGYVIYLLLYAIFSIYLIIANTRKLNWIHIRKRFFTFITWFISLSAVHYLIDYFFRHSEIDVWGFTIPLGLALGLAFSDLMTLKKKG